MSANDYQLEIQMYKALLRQILKALEHDINLAENLLHEFIGQYKNSSVILDKEDYKQLKESCYEIHKLKEDEYEILTNEKKSSFYHTQLEAEIYDKEFSLVDTELNRYDTALIQQYEKGYLESMDTIQYKELPLEIKNDLEFEFDREHLKELDNYEKNMNFLTDKELELERQQEETIEKENVEIIETSRWRNSIDFTQDLEIEMK